MRLAFVLFAFLVVSSCASYEIRTLGSSDSLTSLKNNEGVVLLSMAVPNDPNADQYGLLTNEAVKSGLYDTTSLTFRTTRSDTPLRYPFSFPTKFGGALNADVENADRKAAMYALRLPEGDYEVFRCNLSEYNGVTRATLSADRFSIPFSVRRGKITYLGELRFVMLKGKSALGTTVDRGGFFVFSDMSDEDIPLYKEKYAAFDWETLIIDVIDEGVGYQDCVRIVT